MRTKRATSVLALAVVVLAACGTGSPPQSDPSLAATPPSSPTLEPTATLPSPTANTVGLPDGWQRIQADGFSLAVPTSWETVAASDIASSGAMDALREANPAAAPVIASAEAMMRAGQVQLFAFDPGPRTRRTGFATNVNVIHVGDTGDEDIASLLDDMEASVASQIPVNGRIRRSTTTLPGGEAAVLRYEWTVGFPNGTSMDVAVTQYLVVTAGNGYVITLTGPKRFARHDRAYWETVAFSFRFG
jgi:hypothetical protein